MTHPHYILVPHAETGLKTRENKTRGLRQQRANYEAAKGELSHVAASPAKVEEAQPGFRRRSPLGVVRVKREIN